MSKTVQYEGYTIQSSPKYLEGREQWQLCIVISVEQPGGTKRREFSATGLYATEQEAEIDGIAFGQRLIDGKVEGQSLTDMKMSDRRSTPRFRVQFRTTIFGYTQLEGAGIMLDISAGGCRLECSKTLEPGLLLELRIYVPTLDWPLTIDGANVQWVSGELVGLAFFRISEPERQRLHQVIVDLGAQSE